MIYSNIMESGSEMTEHQRRDYQGLDLRVRRAATGITGTELARLAVVQQSNYSGMENNKRRVPEGLVRDSLMRVEEAVTKIVDQLYRTAAATGDDPVVLTTYDSDKDFAAQWPDYHWLPASAHRCAVGRVAALLEAQGRYVRIQKASPLTAPASKTRRPTRRPGSPS